MPGLHTLRATVKYMTGFYSSPSPSRQDELIEVFTDVVMALGQTETFLQDAEKLISALARKHTGDPSLVGLRRVRADMAERRLQRTSFVYLAVSRCERYVKIGYSSDPTRRVHSFRTYGEGAWTIKVPDDIEDAPPTILATIFGGRSVERELHNRFASARDAGERFRLSDPELRQFVSEHTGSFPDLPSSAGRRIERAGLVRSQVS